MTCDHNRQLLGDRKIFWSENSKTTCCAVQLEDICRETVVRVPTLTVISVLIVTFRHTISFVDDRCFGCYRFCCGGWFGDGCFCNNRCFGGDLPATITAVVVTFEV